MLPAWESALADLPDRALSRYLLSGIKEGFRIGFDHSRWPNLLCPAQRNMGSAKANPEVVQRYIDTEMQAGRLIPVDGRKRQIHISSFSVILKRQQPGKWRLIVDLSAPHGFSVNEWHTRSTMLAQVSFGPRRGEDGTAARRGGAHGEDRSAERL